MYSFKNRSCTWDLVVLVMRQHDKCKVGLAKLGVLLHLPQQQCRVAKGKKGG